MPMREAVEWQTVAWRISSDIQQRPTDITYRPLILNCSLDPSPPSPISSQQLLIAKTTQLGQRFSISSLSLETFVSRSIVYMHMYVILSSNIILKREMSCQVECVC